MLGLRLLARGSARALHCSRPARGIVRVAWRGAGFGGARGENAPQINAFFRLMSILCVVGFILIPKTRDLAVFLSPFSSLFARLRFNTLFFFFFFLFFFKLVFSFFCAPRAHFFFLPLARKLTRLDFVIKTVNL
jgi:hypothetical protein